MYCFIDVIVGRVLDDLSLSDKIKFGGRDDMVQFGGLDVGMVDEFVRCVKEGAYIRSQIKKHNTERN